MLFENTKTELPPRVKQPRASIARSADLVGRCRSRRTRSPEVKRLVCTKSSGTRWRTPSAMNNVSVPNRSRNIPTAGEPMVPTIGPMTAMSPVLESSPKTSAHASHAMVPSASPFTNRKPTRGQNSTRPEPTLAMTPSSTAATSSLRRGRNTRPDPHEPITKPKSWVLEMSPTRFTLMLPCSERPVMRNGVAINTRVLTAEAAKMTGGTRSRSVASARIGV